MKDFTYHAPTEVVFGRKAEEQVAPLLKKYGGTRVLVVFGGGSVRRSGLLDRVCGQLAQEGIDYLPFGGVVPNPRLSMAREGIDLCRKEGIDFLLAVGGGSVIDMCKAIAYGVPYAGDVWAFFLGRAKPQAALPVGCVLTFPASGSEMSDSCVITDEANLDKRGVSSPFGRARFATLNPELSYTLPPYQTAAGVTDIMMHTMERYFSREDDMDLTDGIAEALLRSMKENVFKVLADPQDYRARAQIMWGGSLSHNGLTECGLVRDWSCHKLEHELSGVFDVTHGAGLAAIWSSWARYVMSENVSRFVQFAVNVMGVENDFSDPQRTAERGIEAIERFYHAIGMPVGLKELLGREATDEEMHEMARKCCHDGQITQGNFKVLRQDDVEAIYHMANF